MTEAECRGADWYKVGERDGGTYGLRPQVDIYAHQCGAYKVSVAEQPYMQGWLDGYREYAIRVSGSESTSPP